jgi:CheY-like chemotaxis protein
MDFSPDGIILDNDMPDGLGITLCREIRGISAVPIMLISNSKDDELPALHAGTNDFLKKPFDYEILKARVSVMLSVNPGYSPERDSAEAGKSADKPDETKDATQLLKLRRTNAQQESDWTGGQKYAYFCVYAAACLIIAFAGFSLIRILTANHNVVEFGEGPVPLASFILPDEGAAPYAGGIDFVEKSDGYRMPDYEGAEIFAEASNMWMTLPNPEGNPCRLAFEIALEGTGEIIYRSGLIEPGMCVKDFKLLRELEQGENRAELIINVYELDSPDEITDAGVAFSILVK